MCVCVPVCAHIYKYIHIYIYKSNPLILNSFQKKLTFFPKNPHGKLEVCFFFSIWSGNSQEDRQNTMYEQPTSANMYWLPLVMPPAFEQEPFFRFIFLFLILHCLSLSSLSSNTLRSAPHSFPWVHYPHHLQFHLTQSLWKSRAECNSWLLFLQQSHHHGFHPSFKGSIKPQSHHI